MNKKQLIILLSIMLIFVTGVISGLKWVNNNPYQWSQVDEIRY